MAATSASAATISRATASSRSSSGLRIGRRGCATRWRRWSRRRTTPTSRCCPTASASSSRGAPAPRPSGGLRRDRRRLWLLLLLLRHPPLPPQQAAQGPRTGGRRRAALRASRRPAWSTSTSPATRAAGRTRRSRRSTASSSSTPTMASTATTAGRCTRGGGARRGGEGVPVRRAERQQPLRLLGRVGRVFEALFDAPAAATGRPSGSCAGASRGRQRPPSEGHREERAADQPGDDRPGHVQHARRVRECGR